MLNANIRSIIANNEKRHMNTERLDLKAFVAVAEVRNFVGSAENIGASLFERSTRAEADFGINFFGASHAEIESLWLLEDTRPCSPG
jgi:hypothetical protein